MRPYDIQKEILPGGRLIGENTQLNKIKILFSWEGVIHVGDLFFGRSAAAG